MAESQATDKALDKIAIVGSGLVGKSWATLFACAGHDVRLYDVSKDQLHTALKDIEDQLSFFYGEDLQRSDLTLTQVLGHITIATSLEDCVAGATYIQECVPEDKDLKRDVWRQIDDIMESNDVIFASSTSAMIPSLLSDHLKKRERFIVAHPINPPLLNPLVEVVGAPWTDPSTIQRARVLLESVGQVPVVLQKEVDGFAQVRIQAAILHVAWQLLKEDYVDVDGLETAMHEGLGYWYAFLGPFDTEHLNADGFVDLCNKYADGVEAVQNTFPEPELMQGPTVDKLAAALAQWTPEDQLAERRQWRDRRMAALLKLKRQLDEEEKIQQLETTTENLQV